jgi:hypothetical protein
VAAQGIFDATGVQRLHPTPPVKAEIRRRQSPPFTTSGHLARKTRARTTRKDLEELVEDLDEANEIIQLIYTITSYGADYPVDALVNRMKAGDIVVPRFNWEPEDKSEIVGFQREYVWPRPKADKFIESLLLGLPVPGIFLVKEGSGRLLVLDGHQRLYTLRAFYDGVIHGVEYRLHNVQDKFANLRYEDLSIEDRRRLDDSIIHATVVRQDAPDDSHSGIYIIFERLNTGGVNLQPQEIRVALYHGALVGVLRKLNDTNAWRALYGNVSKRLKDMELILRFFALFYFGESYSTNMKDFLNRYMSANRHLKRQSAKELNGIFEATTALILSALGRRAFRPQRAINAAVVDSLMVGIARRLTAGPVKDKQKLRKRFDALKSNKKYITSIETGTSQPANVATRLRLATAAFADVR